MIATKIDEFNARARMYATSCPDFFRVVRAARPLELCAEAWDLILSSNVGPHLFFLLATNPDQEALLCTMAPEEQLRVLRTLENVFTVETDPLAWLDADDEATYDEDEDDHEKESIHG